MLKQKACLCIMLVVLIIAGGVSGLFPLGVARENANEEKDVRQKGNVKGSAKAPRGETVVLKGKNLFFHDAGLPRNRYWFFESNTKLDEYCPKGNVITVFFKETDFIKGEDKGPCPDSKDDEMYDVYVKAHK